MCMKVIWYILEYFFASHYWKFKNFNWYCNSRNLLYKKNLQPKFIEKYDRSFYLDLFITKARKWKITFFMPWVDSYVTQSWNDFKYLNILNLCSNC